MGFENNEVVNARDRRNDERRSKRENAKEWDIDVKALETA